MRQGEKTPVKISVYERLKIPALVPSFMRSSSIPVGFTHYNMINQKNICDVLIFIITSNLSLFPQTLLLLSHLWHIYFLKFLANPHFVW